MSWVAAAVAGGTIVGGYLSSEGQKDAANTASQAQLQASQEGIAEQRRQFDQVRSLLLPFAQSGQMALGSQGRLLGFYGRQAQQEDINALQQSPMYTSALKVGENRILANASATGGLRGGNVQAALAQFAPQLLAQTINDQYTRLGGITSLGQNAAAGVGNAGMATGTNIAGLLQQGGAAVAGGALAAGRADAGFYGAVGQGLGAFQSMGGFSRLAAPSPDAVSGGFGTGAAYGNQDIGAFL